MEKSTRFFWVYTIVLFVVAFVLILLSSLTATRTQEELDKSLQVYKGAQNSINTLTQENESLKQSLAAKDEEISALQGELSDLNLKIEGLEAEKAEIKANLDKLLSAEDLYEQGKYTQSNNTLSTVKRDLLGATAAKKYDSLTKKLKDKR